MTLAVVSKCHTYILTDYTYKVEDYRVSEGSSPGAYDFEALVTNKDGNILEFDLPQFIQRNKHKQHLSYPWNIRVKGGKDGEFLVKWRSRIKRKRKRLTNDR